MKKYNKSVARLQEEIRKMKFYKCYSCGNIITSKNDLPTMTCCGANMEELKCHTKDEFSDKHIPIVYRCKNKTTVIVGEILHPNSKAHYIEWVLLETENGYYKKWINYNNKPVLSFTIPAHEKILNVYTFCNIHGLYVSNDIIFDYKDDTKYADTKTLFNLYDAFTNECEARVKYEFFSSLAKKSGYDEIAEIFNKASKNEYEHAKLWFKELGLISTIENALYDSINLEKHEATSVYKKFADEALAEGFDALSIKFNALADIEKEHQRTFEEILGSIQNNTIFHKDEEVYWICRNCGNIVKSKDAPEVCSVCDHKMEYYEVNNKNY